MENLSERDIQIQGGTRVIRHTRIPVEHLVQHIDEGWSFEEYSEVFRINKVLARKIYNQVKKR